VNLRYSHNLILRLRDNGKGIDAGVASGGKPGHFGLRGMQERAQRIRATLHLRSRPGAGTEIELTVPGRMAFKRSKKGRLT